MRGASNQTNAGKPDTSDAVGPQTALVWQIGTQDRRVRRSTFFGAHAMTRNTSFHDNPVRLRAALARKARLGAIGLLIAASLSGCGVFCGAAGGSGGGVAGGCGTGMRF
jgi:hypothetical protein